MFLENICFLFKKQTKKQAIFCIFFFCFTQWPRRCPHVMQSVQVNPVYRPHPPKSGFGMVEYPFFDPKMGIFDKATSIIPFFPFLGETPRLCSSFLPSCLTTQETWWEQEPQRNLLEDFVREHCHHFADLAVCSGTQHAMCACGRSWGLGKQVAGYSLSCWHEGGGVW